MPELKQRQAERRLQLSFRKSDVFSGLLVAGLVIGARYAMSGLPDRVGQADTVAAVTFAPVRLGSEGSLRIAGAWRVKSNERRLGGLSALAVDGRDLVALSDSGVVVRLPKPDGASSVAHFRDLPNAPGDSRRKSGRDSEALARLADGDWLVAFENRNQVWRYDAGFQHGRRVVLFTNQGWPTNRGIEAMALGRAGRLVMIPEGRGLLVAVDERVETRPLASEGWTVSDAARAPDGRTLLLLRRITVTGFRNALGELVRTKAGWRVAVSGEVPLGPLDNAEGLAAEPMPAGGTRLWIVTDNDFAGYRRTLLLAVNLSARRPPR